MQIKNFVRKEECYIMYKTADGIIRDSFQAFLVDGANFTENEEYPIIEEWMIPTIPPNRIITFSEAINYRGDLSNYYVCFYAQDETFERIRKNPKKYNSFFKRCAGLIGFDFSIHSDMPIIKQKSQMNDNLCLTYYYGKQGNKVIPNLRCGVDELLPEFLAAIPKHSLVAVGTYGFIKEKHQKVEWYCFIENIVNELEPSGIIVYGSLTKDIVDDFGNVTNFYLYDSWSVRRRKDGNINGN